MSLNFFAGKIEGRPFVAAQTLIPAEQTRAGMMVDSMTTRYGTRIPQFEKGWLARAVDPQLPPHHVVETLENVGRVIEVGEVRREDVARFIGEDAVEAAFQLPEEESVA